MDSTPHWQKKRLRLSVQVWEYIIFLLAHLLKEAETCGIRILELCVKGG